MVDILADFPGWSLEFDLSNRLELSRHASGRTRSKNLGDPVWMGVWQTRQLRPNALDYWRAILKDIENRQEEFDGYALSRCRPIMHSARGPAVPGPLTINAVGGDNRSFSLSGAMGLKLRVGDMVQVGDAALYRVLSNSDDGEIFDVSPQLRAGTAPADEVSVLKPHCPMTIEPGSIQTQASLTGWGTVIFQAVESRG